MDTVTQTILVTGAVGIPISVIVEFIKGQLEKGLVKPNDPNHDATIRLMAGVVGVIWFIISAALQHPITNGTVISTAILQGFGAGLAAIGIYHGVPGSAPPPDLGLSADEVHDIVNNHTDNLDHHLADIEYKIDHHVGVESSVKAAATQEPVEVHSTPATPINTSVPA